MSCLKTLVAPLAAISLLILVAAEPAVAKSLEIIVSKDAHQLEQHAGSELQHYLQRLFETAATVVASPTGEADATFLLGTSKNHPGPALGLGDLPPLSDQGFHLRATRWKEKPAMLIIGGSPAAALWGVYELAERYGVCYLLSGDVLPSRRKDFFLPEIDKTFEPVFRLRWWKGMGDFAMGTEGWGMADYRPLIDQLAKLKFNRIRVGSGPSQPFLHLEIRGVKQQFATLWYDERFPITPDMPGRSLFGEEKEFWNPDLPPREAGYERLSEAGRRHCHQLIAYARSRGIEASFVASVTDFPKEFRSIVPDAQVINQLGGLTVGPGPNVRPDNPDLVHIAGTVIRTIIDTYPQVESYGFPVGTEWRSWTELYDWAWRELDKQYRINEIASLEEVLRKAHARTDYPDGAERSVREAKGDITGLYFLARLWSDPQIVPKSRKPDARLVVYEPAEEIYPILGRVLPKGSELVIVIDYTATGIVRRKSVLGTTPAKEVPTTLVLPVHEDNLGVIPQLTTGSLHELVREMRKCGLAGFCTRQWMISDLDPPLAYLSRAGWDPEATPESIYTDQVRRVCGEAAVGPMLECFRELEAVTAALERHDVGFSFPVPSMMLRHWSPGVLSKEYAEDRQTYRRALAAARKASSTGRPDGDAYVRYWVGRLQFAVGYFDAIEAVKKAATAEQEARDAKTRGDASTHKTKLTEAIAQAEAAQSAAFEAIETLAGVAKNRADLGTIATMAEFVYRPLKRKSEELRAQQ